jgi:hypothetical protein
MHERVLWIAGFYRQDHSFDRVYTHLIEWGRHWFRKKKVHLQETVYPFLCNDLRLSACRSADKERGTSPLKAVRSIVRWQGNTKNHGGISTQKRARCIRKATLVGASVKHSHRSIFYGITSVWQGYYITALQMESWGSKIWRIRFPYLEANTRSTRKKYPKCRTDVIYS